MLYRFVKLKIMADIENPIEQESKETENNTWRSCSGCIIDKRTLGFFTTLGISLVIIAFCITKLFMSLSCEEGNVYMGLLMFVIGIWCRSPTV
jgi:hypothetical protein